MRGDARVSICKPHATTCRRRANVDGRGLVHRWLVVLLAMVGALASMSCAGSARSRPDRAQGWVLVEVRGAVIEPTSESGETWDRDVSAERERQRRETSEAAVGFIGFLAPELAPVLGLLSALGASPPNGDANAADPDVRVQVDFRHGVVLIRIRGQSHYAATTTITNLSNSVGGVHESGSPPSSDIVSPAGPTSVDGFVYE